MIAWQEGGKPIIDSWHIIWHASCGRSLDTHEARPSRPRLLGQSARQCEKLCNRLAKWAGAAAGGTGGATGDISGVAAGGGKSTIRCRAGGAAAGYQVNQKKLCLQIKFSLARSIAYIFVYIIHVCAYALCLIVFYP